MVDLLPTTHFDAYVPDTDAGPILSSGQHPVSQVLDSRPETLGNQFQLHRPESPASSEDQLQSQLQFSAGKVGSDYAVTGVGCDGVGSLCVGMIKDFEGLGPELEPDLLKAQGKALVHAEVEVVVTGGAGNIARAVEIGRAH